MKADCGFNRLLNRNQPRLFLIRSPFRQNLPTPQQFKQRVLAHRTILPGGDSSVQLLRRHGAHVEIGVELHDDLIIGDVIRVFLG